MRSPPIRRCNGAARGGAARAACRDGGPRRDAGRAACAGYARPTAPTPDDDALVRVIDYLPGVSQQLVYATDENFTGRPIYGFTDAYLRYGTVQKLGQAAAALEQLGLTLVIWDAYRPLAAQQALFAAYPDPQYVSDPATGRRTHCRGGAVDVTLADATGALLEMPSGLTDFSERADRDYSDCSAEAAEHARLRRRSWRAAASWAIPASGGI